MLCGNCKKECNPLKIDLSFSHEFGVEEQHAYGSDCCEADIYDELCESCNGTGSLVHVGGTMGFKSKEKCDDCAGTGLSNKLDIDDDYFEPERGDED